MVTPDPATTDEPDPWDKVTLWPGTELPSASSNVTVTVEAEVPLFGTEVGTATTEEIPALTGPGTKVTWAVPLTVISSVVSMAV